jgi:hypothetical protein
MGSSCSYNAHENVLTKEDLRAIVVKNRKSVEEKNNDKNLLKDDEVAISNLKFTLYHEINIKKRVKESAEKGYSGCILEDAVVKTETGRQNLKKLKDEYELYIKNIKKVDVDIFIESTSSESYKVVASWIKTV